MDIKLIAKPLAVKTQAENLRHYRSQPIKRVYISCTEPKSSPSVEELEPGEVLRGPDGQLHRRVEG